MSDTPRPPTGRDADPGDPAEEDRDASADGETGPAPVPFAPDEDDDTPLGDTDQHSDA